MSAILYIFLASYGTKSWRPNFNKTQCLDDATTIGHQTCRKTNFMVVNKTWTVEVHIIDNHSQSSCRREVSDSDITFSSALQPTKHDALWPCTINAWLLTSANTRCPCTLGALVNMPVFCTDLSPKFGDKNNSRVFHSIIRTMGHKTTTTV